jgi:hypothetical protein
LRKKTQRQQDQAEVNEGSKTRHQTGFVTVRQQKRKRSFPKKEKWAFIFYRASFCQSSDDRKWSNPRNGTNQTSMFILTFI